VLMAAVQAGRTVPAQRVTPIAAEASAVTIQHLFVGLTPLHQTPHVFLPAVVAVVTRCLFVAPAKL
jgi:hypothetical protein